MRVSEFTDILQQQQPISEKEIDDLKMLIDEFPYLQSARALYLKGLKTTGSFKYNQELKSTAAHTTDRSVLFDFITSDTFVQNAISKHIKQNFDNLKDIELHDIEDISVNKSVVIDDALKQHIKDSERVLDPKLFETKIQVFDESFEVAQGIVEKTPEEQLEIGKPLEFDKNETHSFSEWLKITSFKPIIRQEDTQISADPKNDVKQKKLELIDKFIETNPKISPVKKEGSLENIAALQLMPAESLMTETLARIYLEQKNYEKAIQSYKILSLKYPEKSGFFADQISAIRKIQEQNNIK